MNSAFSYFGGKARMAKHITPLIPLRMDAYIEAYFGSGVIFFAARGRWAEVEICNDINKDVTNFFEVLRDNRRELIRVLSLTLHARDEYNLAWNKLRSNSRISKIERARCFFVRVEQSFSNMQKINSWKVPGTKTSDDRARRWQAMVNSGRLEKISERLQDASFENVSALDLIKNYDDPGVFFYFDPPYIVTEKKKMQDINKAYTGNGAGLDHHEKLVEKLLRLRGMAILSGYDHPVYSPLVKAGWQRINIKTKTQVANNTSTKDKTRTESLWLNPALQAANRQRMLF